MALYLAIQIGGFLSRIVPRSWRYLIGTAIGDSVFWVWGEKRRILLSNMAHILGLGPRDPRVRRLAVRSMRNYCKYLIEFLELPLLSPHESPISDIEVRGMEHLTSALEHGKGVIVATAHFGTIEVGALRLAGLTSDFHAVYDTFKPAYLDRLIQNTRRKLGINPVPVRDVRQMLRVLKRGGVLALLFDRPLPGDEGVPVQFFGRETAVPAGPAVLALKTGATILPIYQFRQPDRSFECVVFPAIKMHPTGDRRRDVQAVMQRIVDTLQSVVKERPDQWYMFRPVWSGPTGRVRSELPSPRLGDHSA